MSKTTTTTITAATIDRFKAALAQAVDGMKTAAAIYIDAINSGTDQELRDAMPQLAPRSWNMLESIGMGTMDPRLFFEGGAAAHALRRLPVSEQKRALDKGVEVYAGGTDRMVVPVHKITPEQAKLVFAYDHVRDLPEQRQILQTEAVVRKPAAPRQGYEVGKNAVMINVPMKLTKNDLLRILAEMG
jgi:hypothetical protein